MESLSDGETVPIHEIFWTSDSIQHVADNGLSPADVEHAVRYAVRATRSRRSGLPAYVGPDCGGEMVFVVYDEIDAVQIVVVTAFRMTRWKPES